MVGHRGGYRYRYYMCGNARRKGREVCPSPILRKDKVEGFVTSCIKDCILTEENLRELVRLTNEELVQTCAEEREKLQLLQIQITETDSRLGKLYDALETGEFKGGELAPRIQALFQKKEELQQAKADVEQALRYQAVDMADPQVVRDYVDDLRGLLERSSIIEQRGFLKSFVDRIEVGDSEVKMYYTIPMPPSSLAEKTVGVIPFVHHG
jgi:site-specific DNA recombinase